MVIHEHFIFLAGIAKARSTKTRPLVSRETEEQNANSADMLQCKIKVKQKDELSQQPVVCLP